MKWTLEWGPIVYRDVQYIPWRTASRLCEAIIRYAETNRGPVARASADNPRQLKLVVPGAVALMNVDPAAGVLLVTRAFPRRH